MSYRFRTVLWCAVIGLVISNVGCALVPQSRLAACQSYNCQLQRKNQEVCAQYENLRIQNQELANKNLDAEEKLAQQEELLANYQKNGTDYEKMRQLYAQAIEQGGRPTPVPKDVRRRLEEFARDHPEFVEVDAEAGISKFNTDLLFPSGKAELSAKSEAALREFAQIFHEGGGRAMNIQIVGHADTQQIKRPETKARYGSNWDLSAARSLAVVQYLQQSGIDPKRLGVSAYSQYQPVDRANSSTALSKNRRVEIYVLAPDSPMVGRTDWLRQY